MNEFGGDYKDTRPDYLNPEKLHISREEISREVALLEQHGAYELLQKRVGAIEISGASIAKGSRNADAMLGHISPDGSFFCAGVLDGVSSNSKSAEFSHELVRNLSAQFRSVSNPEYEEVLAVIYRVADEAVHKAQQQGFPENVDTTMTIAFGVKVGSKINVYMVHVGDSRGYVQKGKADSLTQKTKDMSVPASIPGLSKLEQKINIHRNVVSHFVRLRENNPNKGTKIAWFPYRTELVGTVEAGQSMRIRLASDGYTDNFHDDPINATDEIASHAVSGYSAVETVAAASIRGSKGIDRLSKKDDVTVVDVFIGDRFEYEAFDEGGDKVPSEVGVGLKEVEVDRIWQALYGDKQLRGLLAEFALNSFESRDLVEKADIYRLLTKYGKRSDLENSGQFESLLRSIESLDKKDQYRQKYLKFLDIVYDSVKPSRSNRIIIDL